MGLSPPRTRSQSASPIACIMSGARGLLEFRNVVVGDGGQRKLAEHVVDGLSPFHSDILLGPPLLLHSSRASHLDGLLQL